MNTVTLQRCVSRVTVGLMPYSDARMRSKQEALPSCSRCIQLADIKRTLSGPWDPRSRLFSATERSKAAV